MKTKAEYHREKFMKKHGIAMKDGTVEVGPYRVKIDLCYNAPHMAIMVDKNKLLSDFKEGEDIFYKIVARRGGDSYTAYADTGISTVTTIRMNKAAFDQSMETLEYVFYHELGHSLLHSLNFIVGPRPFQYMNEKIFDRIGKTCYQYQTNRWKSYYDTYRFFIKDFDSNKYLKELQDDFNKLFQKQKEALHLSIKKLHVHEDKPISFREDLYKIIDEYFNRYEMQSGVLTNSDAFLLGDIEVEADMFAAANIGSDLVIDSLYALKIDADPEYRESEEYKYAIATRKITVAMLKDERVLELLPYYRIITNGKI